MSQINMQLDVSFLTRPIPDEQGIPASEGEIYDTEMTLIVDDDGVQINLYPEARNNARIRVEHDKRTGRIVCLIWLKGQAVGDPDQMIELVPAVEVEAVG